MRASSEASAAQVVEPEEPQQAPCSAGAPDGAEDAEDADELPLSTSDLDEDFGKLFQVQPQDVALAIKLEVGRPLPPSACALAPAKDMGRTSFRAMVLEDQDRKDRVKQAVETQIAAGAEDASAMGRAIDRVRCKLECIRGMEDDFDAAH